MKKKTKIMTGILLFFGIFMTGSTYAFLSDLAVKENRIAVGANTIEVVEQFPDPGTVQEDENPSFMKTVWIVNSGGEKGFQVPCYVRAKISFSNWDIGKAVTLCNLAPPGWIAADDGYYYYTKILGEGERTPALFTDVAIDSSKIEKRYRDTIPAFSISVYAESVQAEGFRSYAEAWLYDNWNE